ncbi:MAG TPA: N-6 DNA methylase, partial [Thermovirgaceae bacterium]|nr:N-6 DNA methylase [Thermovirgaceae bacterium]
MAQLEHIEAIEKRLWSAADTLRSNSNFASNEYFLPVMGLIFLRHAYSRFLAVKSSVEETLPRRGGKARPLSKEDFSQKSAIFLQPKAQFDHLVALSDSSDRARAIIEAMESIESDYENLRGVLPKSEYQELDNDVLGQLLRTLNPDELKKVNGDVFGRIYEYFLTQFADLKAHDGGEFFTPVSLVSLIANVLEPENGVVLDPACGSGGMFVQSARFVERRRENPVDRLTFYGLEKNATTIRLAKMNLAVHGLEGDIQKAITYYEDPHELLGKANFVMANPPFNVDEIDADKVRTDPRLPFGLPGVNKGGKVSNGNYVWISYFYSYLNENGRAGFVMSSQASSAGGGEAKVRQKLVETGDMDVMIAIRPNFFYTRTVPCELWFIDRGKPDQPSPLAPLPEGEEGNSYHYRGGYNFSGLVELAREFRKNQTPAEDCFWSIVQNRKFLGLKFRRQHQVGDYVVDFYCKEASLAVELDGPVHDLQTKRDAKRDAYLKSQGVHVLRIKNGDLLEKTQATLEQLANRIFSSSEIPLPLGEETGEGDVALNHKGNVLMIDARNVYRKVTRKIYDFSPEQEQNILAIVWLYRGQTEKYLDLVGGYCRRMLAEGEGCFAARDDSGEKTKPLPSFIASLTALREALQAFLANPSKDVAFEELQKELEEAVSVFKGDVETFREHLSEQQSTWEGQKITNGELKKAVDRLVSLGESSRDLVKQTDLIFKIASRFMEAIPQAFAPRQSSGGNGIGQMKRQLRDLDVARALAVDQLKQVRYFWKQARWLTERFPEAKLCDVPGLVKLVDKAEIEANDWSLTPGRYVGVAPEEVDENFDFEETLREIHVEL